MSSQQPSGDPDRAGLAELLRSGDLVAAERLVDAFGVPVQALLAQLTGSWDVAERLLPQVFRRVWRDRARAPKDAGLPAFVLGHAAQVVSAESPATASGATGTGADAALLSALAPLAVLSQRDRTAWVLHHWHGLAPAEVARALHLGRRPAAAALEEADRQVGTGLPEPERRPVRGHLAEQVVLQLADEPDDAERGSRGTGRRRALLGGVAALAAAAAVATAVGVHRHPWHAATSPASSASPSPRTFDQQCRAQATKDAQQGRRGALTEPVSTIIVDETRPLAAELLHDDTRHLAMCTGDGILTYPDPHAPWPMVSVAVASSEDTDLVAGGLPLPGSVPTQPDTTLLGDPVEPYTDYWIWHRHITARETRSLPALAALKGGTPPRTMVVPWLDGQGPDDASSMDANTSLAQC